jgi:hypothetical protein
MTFLSIEGTMRYCVIVHTDEPIYQHVVINNPQIQLTRKQEWEECYNIIGSFSDYLTYVHDNTSLHMHCTFKTSYKWRTRPFTKGVDNKILLYSVNLNVYLILILT